MKNRFTASLLALMLATGFASSAYAAIEGGGGGGGTPPTISYFTATPTSVSAGSSSTLSWSADRGTCTGVNFTPGARIGSLAVTPSVTTTYTLTCSNAYGSDSTIVTVTVTGAAYSNLTAGTVTPTTATVGVAVTLTGSVSNTGAASTGAGFTNLFQRATDVIGTNATDIGTHIAAALVAGSNTSATLSYTFPSAATWYVRVCADKSSAVSAGTITESNEADNCGAWTAIVASSATAPTVSLSASPTSITSGQSSTLTWSSTNATTCSGVGFSTGNQTSGSVSVSPATTTTYTLTCTGVGGTTNVTTNVTVSAGSTTTTTTYTNALCSGGTYLGSSAGYTNACVSYCTGVSASCCSTYYNYGDDSDSYSCVAYSGTSATTSSPTSGGCSGGGGGYDGGFSTDGGAGEPYCNWTTKSATLINYGPAVTASLVANPTSISAGQQAVLTWSSDNATTCSGTNFSTSGAVSGSVTVAPTTTTTYTLTCTGAGGTASSAKTLTVNVFTVTCSPSPSPVTVLQSVSWSSAATGGTGSYTYSWSGTDGLSGSGAATSQTYATLGEKTATLSVTSGGDTITTACTGTPCQQPSCTCSGSGCGVVVQEGVSSDVTGSTPSLSVGSLYPGGSVTFGASIQNIGNNSISSVFQNRFQVDIGADGTYDLNLDTGGSAGSEFTLEYGKSCTAGTIVGTESVQVYGAGSVTSSITDICSELATSGQCCNAVVTTGSSGGGGGGGGGGNTNLVSVDRNLAALFKSLAITYYDIDITVRSSATTGSCPSGQSCYAGTWQALSGTQYDIPYSTWYGVLSPQWTNIPGGTHTVRFCADSPTSQLGEANEGNNCGPDYTFTVSGFDLTSGTSGINSGTLISGQAITFFSTVSNNPSTYVESGQCQATVVVTTGGACSLALSSGEIRWTVTDATSIDTITALTTSPPVPATGAGGMIVSSPGELGFFTSQALKADMLAHGGVNFSETSFTYRTGNSDQVSMDRACKMITGNMQATAKAWGSRGWSSCGNNGNLKFDGTNWASLSGCIGAHLYSQLDCQYPGSPYTIPSGSYEFPSTLSTGTHTYELDYTTTTGTGSCSATIVVPEQGSGLCTLVADPSIIDPGGTSELCWATTGASDFSINQGIGSVTPVASGCYEVSPPTTTTYTGSATTDTTTFEFDGCAPSEFQIDQGNDGTVDTALAAPQCITTLDIDQSTQVESPPWTAVVGTHAVRLCANEPLTEDESDTGNNCGQWYVFTVSPPTQCEDDIDNNGNGLVDLADPACTGSGDTTEQSFLASTLSLTSSRSTVKKGATVTLTWSASDVQSGTCRITSSAGDSWVLSGIAGLQATNPILAETTYQLSCDDMQNDQPVFTETVVRIAPTFEEI